MYKLKARSEKRADSVAADQETQKTVMNIIDQVVKRGDSAVLELTEQFDKVTLSSPKVEKSELVKAYEALDMETLEALTFCKEQIEFFAEHQFKALSTMSCQNIEGVTLGHKVIPVPACGCYIPSGRYPLPSSALMSIIPAKIAGVERVVGVAPPGETYGGIHPVVLAAMYISGVDEVYMVGGAQGIAALAYGTETIPKVDMIVGPGNKYVTEAKRQVTGFVGIDQLAGPSEVLIIADEQASPEKIAMDLLAQCEHDPDAVSILVSTSESVAEQVLEHLNLELETLETTSVAEESWKKNGEVIVVDDLDEAIKISDQVAPEHLQVMTGEDGYVLEGAKHYGSLFLGEYASVAFGDYASGTNHILPTNTSARFTGGLWVGKFLKVSSYQMVTKKGAEKLAGPTMHLSELEGLYAHHKSAKMRRES